MIEGSPSPSEVARHLLAHVAPDDQPPDVMLSAVDQAYRQLRERMSSLLGQAGFDALWARALHQVHPGTDALPMLVTGHDPDLARERMQGVFANCFTLLYTFIGGDLSFRLIQQTWPAIPFMNPEAQAEGANQ
jgi:hypothetical protein